MPNETNKPERTYSVTISIFVNSMTAAEAQALEDAVRDAADDFGAQVNTSRGNPVTI